MTATLWQTLRGLEIFATYHPGDRTVTVFAEDGRIYAPMCRVTPEDAELLKSLGWRHSMEFFQWYIET